MTNITAAEKIRLDAGAVRTTISLGRGLSEAYKLGVEASLAGLPLPDSIGYASMSGDVEAEAWIDGYFSRVA
jgi:hypothetical protein